MQLQVQQKEEYKQTELGLLPKEWKIKAFQECISKNRIKLKKIKQQNYKEAGSFPIVDQGQKLIAGYWGEKEDVYDSDLPVIVFGDHTRIVKFIDFPFVRGADGTKIILPKESVHRKFFYYVLKSINIPSKGYNRHYSLLKEKKIPLPPLSEQRNIAFVLSSIQGAKEKTDAVVAALKELKKSLMKHLFTYGPVPIQEAEKVELKETEIGKMPKDWKITKLGDLLLSSQYGLSLKADNNGQYPILGMGHLQDGKILPKAIKYVNLSAKEFSKFEVNKGDVLFNRTNSPDLVGKTSIFDLNGSYVFASYLVRLNVDREKILPPLLNYYMNRLEIQENIKRLASRGVSQSNISATKIKTLDVIVPRIEQQQDIIDKLLTVDLQISAEQNKANALGELFNSMLRDLMTAKVRVNNLVVKNES